MIQRQRYLARYLGPKGDAQLFAIGCPGSGSGRAAFQSSVPRLLARFLSMADDVPLYGYSTCEFPRIGRYLMRFVGMATDGLPVYTLGCCQEGSSGSSGESSGFSGSSGVASGSGASSGIGSSGAGSSGSAPGSGSASGGASSGPGSSSGPSSGSPCPVYPWEMEAFDGATWSGEDWSVRIDFEDSYVCGGTNENTQSGTASRLVCLKTPKRLTIAMNGRVERQDYGYEYAETRVNGALVASGGSVGEGLGCAMTTVNADGSIDLPAGEHLIELFSSTNDPLYHVGAFWEFHFTWEPL